MNANTVPLRDILPWEPTNPRSILICDSVETDGFFVLAAMFGQLISTSSLTPPKVNNLTSITTKKKRQHQKQRSRVLWLSGNETTVQEIAATFKIFGWYDNGVVANNNNMHIRSLAVEMSKQLLLQTQDEDDKNEVAFDEEAFLKILYKDVKTWVLDSNGDVSINDGVGTNLEQEGVSEDSKNYRNDDDSILCWIILDDITALGSMFGEAPVHRFLQSLFAFSVSQQGTRRFGIIIRCSGDVDQIVYKSGAEYSSSNSNSTNGTNNHHYNRHWIGAGGTAIQSSYNHQLVSSSSSSLPLIPWLERAVEQSVDAIIDIIPLPSGFSREAHGRIVFSETPNGHGWGRYSGENGNESRKRQQEHEQEQNSNMIHSTTKTSSWNEMIFNYCKHGSGICRAIRLRSS